VTVRARHRFPVEDLRQVDVQLPGLPEGYGEDRLVLLPRDPDWLYGVLGRPQQTKDRARHEGGIKPRVRLYEHRRGPARAHGRALGAGVLAELVPAGALGRAGVRGENPGTGTERAGGWAAAVEHRERAAGRPVVGGGRHLRHHHARSSRCGRASPSRAGAARPAPESAARVARGSTAPRPARGQGEPPRLPTAEASAGAAAAQGRGRRGGATRCSAGPRGIEFPGSAPWSARGPGAAPGGVPGSPWGGSAQPQRARGEEEVAKERAFWLVADAELIVFGATDPRATVTLGGQRIRLREDGSFSVRMAFPDGKISMHRGHRRGWRAASGAGDAVRAGDWPRRAGGELGGSPSFTRDSEGQHGPGLPGDGLHAHLPFVSSPGARAIPRGGWLYEAITETYLPCWR